MHSLRLKNIPEFVIACLQIPTVRLLGVARLDVLGWDWGTGIVCLLANGGMEGLIRADIEIE